MGYYTNYTLTATGPQSGGIINHIVAASKYDGWEYYDAEWQLNDSKWYDWEEEIKAAVKEFPYAVVTLYAEGEESGDIWKVWASGNMFEQVKIETEIPEPAWVEKRSQVILEKKERAQLKMLKEKYGE